MQLPLEFVIKFLLKFRARHFLAVKTDDAFFRLKEKEEGEKVVKRALMEMTKISSEGEVGFTVVLILISPFRMFL